MVSLRMSSGGLRSYLSYAKIIGAGIIDRMSTLTAEQRAALEADLERSRQVLIEAGRGLTASQWTWKPAPDRWSVAECLEHVAIVETLLSGRLNRMVGAQVDEEAAARVVGREAAAQKAGTSREAKRQAPEMARPAARFGSVEEFDAHFTPLRVQTIEFVRTSDAPLHALVEAHPAIGELSAHQWLWFLSAHCERHAEQAKEVRADPAFPPSDVAS